MSDEKREYCGVFGIWGAPEAANLTYLGLYALQHRGQESAGIAACAGDRLITERGLGLVADIFDRPRLDRLAGPHAIGHVRYATAGQSDLASAQPLAVQCWRGPFAVAHNGNLVNGLALRAELEHRGAIFSSHSDTEVFVHLMAKSKEADWTRAFIEALSRVEGAYSLVCLTPTCLLAARDPYGFRPLVLGDLGGAPILCSESCALDLIGATLVRELEPGEVVVIGEGGVESFFPLAPKRRAHCIFEYIYFARPDSVLFGRSVHRVRRALGRQLAKEAPAAADIVVPVPDSGVWAAMGYAEESGLPFEMGLIRNHYVGRTFIEPERAIRDFGVKIKLNPVREVIRGRRLCVIDDSIVRGTTSRKLVRLLRQAGAAEVHLRISAPPTAWPCYYGIDIPTRDELIAARHTIEETAAFIDADSLGYLSIEGLDACVERQGGDFCMACFDGRYPTLGSDAAASEEGLALAGARRAALRAGGQRDVTSPRGV